MAMQERIAVGRDYLRAGLWRLRGARLAPKVRIGPRCELLQPCAVRMSARVVLEPEVVLKLVGLSARLDLADYVFIGRRSIFDLVGHLKIGKGTLLAPDCFITDHNHGISRGCPIWRQAPIHEPVSIGSDCWLGTKVVILPGVTVGDGAVIAAGAVVVKDVLPFTVVGGVPAKWLRDR